MYLKEPEQMRLMTKYHGVQLEHTQVYIPYRVAITPITKTTGRNLAGSPNRRLRALSAAMNIELMRKVWKISLQKCT
jgi:hypothetical protein